jgi:hypothetical protein
VIRLLVSIVLQVMASAVGLIAAAWILEDMTLDGAAFVIAVLIFTAVSVVLQPLITQIAITKVDALRGGSALVTTFLGLLITALVSDGLQIDGASTWVLATLIVWAATVVAAIVLPLFLFKSILQRQRS